jgi:hypothetical protein
MKVLVSKLGSGRALFRLAHLPLAAALAIASFAALPSTARAANLTVCPSACTFTTIQAALATANSGDVILIGSGTYPGGFVVGQSVKMIGAGPGPTVIDGGTPVLTIGSGYTVTIRSLTITNGTSNGSGGGIINFGTLTVRDSAVSNNVAAGGGGGIVNSTGSTLIIRNSAFSHNVASFGTGIWNQVGASLTVTGTEFNSSNLNNQGSAKVTSSRFHGTNARAIANLGTLTVADSTIENNGNGTAIGAGIGNASGATLTVRNSTISGNYGTAGAGIGNAGTATVIDSTVRGNVASQVGGGIGNTGTLIVRDSTISGNTAVDGGGLDTMTGTVRLEDTTLTNNTAADTGGGVFLGGGTLTLTETRVLNNTPNNCFPLNSVPGCAG